MKLKQLTFDVVNVAATLLIEASPINQTTTLEVKQLVRHLGYNAPQADVSEYMAELKEKCEQAGLGLYTSTVVENGISFHVFSDRRIYSFVYCSAYKFRISIS